MGHTVHMLISILPKYVVSTVVGFIKGKSAIHLARRYAESKRSFGGQRSGQLALLFRCGAVMKRRPASISSIRSLRIEGPISWVCCRPDPLQGVQGTAKQFRHCRLERLTFPKSTVLSGQE